MMKRLRLGWIAVCTGIALAGTAQDIYVSPSGSDFNTGTKEKPIATLPAALRKSRELRRLNESAAPQGIRIILQGGTYFLTEPVFIRPEDAGTKESPTLIEAATGERPVLSGGVAIGNWKRVNGTVPGLHPSVKSKIWVADISSFTGLNFRQLWVNNRKAIRARDTKGETMNRILSWNKTEQSCLIPTPAFEGLQNVKGLEFFIHQWWAIAILRVKKMQVMGDSTKLWFEQPESRIQSEHPWPAPWISKETGNSAFYLSNAIQFLDEPGEWYLDVLKQKLYYWPRASEEMQTAQVIAPVLDQLVIIEGTKEKPVTHLLFKNISFEHSSWLRPSQQGHVPHQNGMYMTDAYRLKPAGTKEKPTLDNQAWVGRPAAAVSVSFASQVGFENCRFEHLASTGLDYQKGVKQSFVTGNLFKDIGGNALLAGVYSDPAQEIHLPYNPADEREICDGIDISNNLVTDATNEDWSCVGIGLGYTRNSVVSHNEVENISYSGITMGWGWSAAPNVMKNNKIVANRIHHFGKHNYDCAGIYTLSAQPGSLIAENVVDSIFKAPYAHLPSHWFYLYTDEGSSGFTVKDNYTPTAKFLQNSNGPDNQWTNNGPAVSASIQQAAGLQKQYTFLQTERTAALVKQEINEQHKEVIELVTKSGAVMDMVKLKSLLVQNGMDSSAVYQWQNHTVIFSEVNDVLVMQGRLQNHFPEVEVKVYHDLFYAYSKQKHCADKSVAAEWDHILLTANLVADPKLQQQYLDYHATQFEKWPDVARGFCNADFQQLLIYKNGRQLILVISIPKGKTLDELNPKTVANNPKMVEWNKIMGKYQEGIEGTKPGEKWVFLNKNTLTAVFNPVSR